MPAEVKTALGLPASWPEDGATQHFTVVSFDDGDDPHGTDQPASVAYEEFEDDGDHTMDESDYQANLDPCDDPTFSKVSPTELCAAAARRLVEGKAVVPYAVLADERSMREARAGTPVTVEWVCLVDEYHEEDDEFPNEMAGPAGMTFRTDPEQTGAVEANLTISNLSFIELKSMAGPDGVLRVQPE